MTAEGTFWVGTSWKMNKTLAEAQAFADGLVSADGSRHPRIERFVIPPFTLVREVKRAGTSVKVGAQNMHWADEGPWTGEISPLMLRDCDLAEDGLGRRVPCLYGGSVNPDNCEELISCPHVNGLFIGR